MKKHTGTIISVNGNMIIVKFDGILMQNELAYVLSKDRRLKAEVIKIRNNTAYLQVFEYTKGIKVNDEVEFTSRMLSVRLGPGMLGQVYDGLQNPLPELAKKFGFFLPIGMEMEPISKKQKWEFTPSVKINDKVKAADTLGLVPEGIFQHCVMVPFYLSGDYTVCAIAQKGAYTVTQAIAGLKNANGEVIDITMAFDWPVKMPINAYKEKLFPEQTLITKARVIDTFFPIAKGGTYCIPGPFGAGKTVLQQLTARHAEVDIVIVAACGERAGEVVETLREFPHINDPRTGKTLMERTIIICNTSSMPVAARESSVYTAATIAEYYRQMGLDVLLLADSTSRWAQAMREISGRLEEIPGDEAYPAYLESRIASFYERAGRVRLNNNKIGTLTIGGTVSPAGGNFEEPVTQGTLKVAGAFHGLSRDRANARKFPSIDPQESWSKYNGFIPTDTIAKAKKVLSRGEEVKQMMKVVGEEGTSIEDFTIYLKAEFLDAVYIQQNGFDPVDAVTGAERQEYVFKKIICIMENDFKFQDKDQARGFFYNLRHSFMDWNYKQWKAREFTQQEEAIDNLLKCCAHEEGYKG